MRVVVVFRSILWARVALCFDASRKYDWFKQWYPVNVVDTMDPLRPNAVSLLGMRLVAWKSNDGWRVFEDSCPHRRAPLSEGRIEADGSLSCSYHGWRFEESGACSSLPYSAEEKHRLSCKARCVNYPTREEHGLLFVFATPDVEMSKNVKPPLVDELVEEPERWRAKIPAGVRDFPCGWDAMAENTLDPAHFCAAHDGTLGDRLKDPGVYTFARTPGSTFTLDDGFALDGDMGTLRFQPPCLVKYAPNYSAMPFKGALVLATYCVPSAPGVVRPLAVVLLDKQYRKGNTLAETALAGYFGPFGKFAWIGHVASSIVLHQDSLLLYHQYRTLRDKGYYDDDVPYQKLAFTPTTVDKGPTDFRKWFKLAGDVPWATRDLALPPRGSEDVFDMWDAHTKNCRYCSDAYRNIIFGKRAAGTLAAAATVLLFSSSTGGGTTASTPFALVRSDQEHLLVVATVASISFLLLDKLSSLFVRYEFSHAAQTPPTRRSY